MVNSVYWKTIKTKVARREGKWVNSVNWKRGYLNNIGSGGQGEGKQVDVVNSVLITKSENET